MRKFLESTGISDAELLQELNRITLQENEVQAKLGKSMVASADANAAMVNAIKDTVRNDLAAEMKSLKLELAKLQEMVSTVSQGTPNQPTAVGPRLQNEEKGKTRYGCPACKATGKQCNHCWTCGGVGHRRNQCPNKIKTTNHPENSRGSS
jgi:seryl-tRNA synthetase